MFVCIGYLFVYELVSDDVCMTP